jgi:hypothetical protein
MGSVLPERVSWYETCPLAFVDKATIVMLIYPIDIKQVSSDLYRAVWVDFADLPRGQGPTAEAAFTALVDKTLSIVADAVARNVHPEPSPSEGRPTVNLTAPSHFVAPHQGRLLSVTPRGTSMKTYGWSNGLAYFE